MNIHKENLIHIHYTPQFFIWSHRLCAEHRWILIFTSMMTLPVCTATCLKHIRGHGNSFQRRYENKQPPESEPVPHINTIMLSLKKRNHTTQKYLSRFITNLVAINQLRGTDVVGFQPVSEKSIRDAQVYLFSSATRFQLLKSNRASAVRSAGKGPENIEGHTTIKHVTADLPLLITVSHPLLDTV